MYEPQGFNFQNISQAKSKNLGKDLYIFVTLIWERYIHEKSIQLMLYSADRTHGITRTVDNNTQVQC